MSFNKVILVGNVGKDPEIRRFENNIKASFSLATSETYTPKGGDKVTQTEWHNIVAWRRLAELAENYIRKGTQVLIEGKLRYRSYDDRDGNKKYIVEVEADVIQLLGRKPDGQNQSSQGQSAQGGTGSYSAPSQPMSSPDNNISEDLTTRDTADDLPF
ncbi:MAG: single-stranded DNA-binding protein [Bacteroidales bacterium]|jgi:single-strand DNA-binding protein|nr:single-stranded DNA-binding protein [Bacteroidales bacterium]MCU0410871.1 single-stranded DNA-binding protein [Bacteroidales bacterium]